MNLALHTKELKVAVVLPVYNGDDPGHLQMAIESVFNQTYPRGLIDLFIAQDGPVNELLGQVINSFVPLGALVDANPINLGLGPNLNRVLLRLTGYKYIFRMDADDVCVPTRFEAQIRYLEEHPQVDILGGGIVEFSSNEETCSINPDRIREYPNSSDVRSMIAKGSPLAHPAVVFRGDFFQSSAGYPNVGWNEDIALWFDSLASGKVIDNIKEPVLFFRLNDLSISRRQRSKAAAEFVVYIRGINKLGLNKFYYIFPMLRYLFRLAPRFLIQAIYKAVRLRNFLMK